MATFPGGGCRAKSESPGGAGSGHVKDPGCVLRLTPAPIASLPPPPAPWPYGDNTLCVIHPLPDSGSLTQVGCSSGTIHSSSSTAALGEDKFSRDYLGLVRTGPLHQIVPLWTPDPQLSRQGCSSYHHRKGKAFRVPLPQFQPFLPLSS